MLNAVMYIFLNSFDQIFSYFSVCLINSIIWILYTHSEIFSWQLHGRTCNKQQFISSTLNILIISPKSKESNVFIVLYDTIYTWSYFRKDGISNDYVCRACAWCSNQSCLVNCAPYFRALWVRYDGVGNGYVQCCI